ncbi:MAG: CHAT domain-containing tetratricopeptide repeat protein [Acidobacteriota bacterium]|nr:CHAT domain-containing tetratricopeptide repeat protein [Acidobacteriota bacterium]
MLTPGAAVSEITSAGETDVYVIDLLAGQHALIEMIKGDLKVKVSVCVQPGRACTELASRRYGRLELPFSADVSGRYEIKVRSVEADAAARGYEIRLVEVADATPRHKLADEAARTAAEAESLREHQDQSSQLAAVRKYGEAQRLWEAAGEFSRAAEALCDMGDLYFALSQYQPALAHYTKALSLGERSGDQLARLVALSGGGYVSVYLGEKQKALSHAQEMLEVVERAEPGKRDSADYRRAKAQALNIMGEVYYSLGELRKSIEMFDLALPLWTDIGERSGQALAFLNLGYSYSDLGNPQAASEHFQRSLALWQSINDGRGAALARTALGGTYSTLGEEQLALNLHKQAAEHFRAIGDKQGAAAALNGVAGAYLDLNEYQAAFDNYFEALRLYEEIGNRDFTALNKFLVGRVLYQKGEAERAFAYYRESLDLSRDVGDRVVEAHALQGLATAYFSRGDVGQALAQFDAALKIYRGAGNRRSQAYALNDIGHIHASSGDVPKALASYAEALQLMREIRDHRGEALTLFNTAKAELENGNLAAALSLVEGSIAIGESLRTKIRNSRLRTSYFASVHKHYELYIDVLMRLHAQQPDKGFAAAALVASERARARSLLDSLFEDKLKPQKGLATELLHREQELLRLLDERAEYQARLLSGKQAGEEAEQVAQEIRALTIEYQDVRSRLREQSPRLATLTQPGQIRAADIQSIVKDDDTLLLEFALGDERSYLWAVSAGEIAGYELPGRATIEGLSRRTYELLTARQSTAGQPVPADEERLREADAEYWRAAAALSAMLLGPVSGRLGSKRLLIVSDGFIRHIPFEALPAPGRSGDPAGAAGLELLFLNHEIVGLPSALTLTALRYEKHPAGAATKTIAVIADPVFEKDDPRVIALPSNGGAPASGGEDDTAHLSSALRDFGGGGDRPVLSRLPSTLREAKAITGVIPAGEMMVATGFDAAKERVVNDGLRDYRIIHFATHGLLNNASPELSGVVLSLINERGESREGFLRLHNIYNMELSADLVVISACRTGLGRNVRGEGVVGLASGFMYAGAKSVVASLWKVDDDATAELMSHFYTAMLRDGLPPAAALRTAKREMWKQERWRAPFYWAAFTLQGEYAESLGVPRRPSLTQMLVILAAVVLVIAAVYAFAVRHSRRARPG